MMDEKKHFCEYDYHLDEACGAPAVRRLWPDDDFWVCQQHYDEYVAMIRRWIAHGVKVEYLLEATENKSGLSQ